MRLAPMMPTVDPMMIGRSLQFLSFCHVDQPHIVGLTSRPRRRREVRFDAGPLARWAKTYCHFNESNDVQA